MRYIGLGILAVGALLATVLGWEHIWHVLREGRGLSLVGWMVGLVGLALLAGRRRQQGIRRMQAGLLLAAAGLALMAVPVDVRGLFAGVRVGYAGSLLALMPHTIRIYRSTSRRAIEEAAPMQGVL